MGLRKEDRFYRNLEKKERKRGSYIGIIERFMTNNSAHSTNSERVVVAQNEIL